ncbi:ATPase associated with various cellular activities AAA_3 [Hydrogenobaculum sp. Y04AAS1]|uniref:AAA family ATPase n=1 Tax=Hydrogenobaculum sp. (strain Y04AAS1) TaxID=380749 RepID=UPI00015BCE85|nr:ATPase associated with various cellular activities AAA_3 [Hydrogenobaculum sp. Y04AAS1]HCT66686.1 MoxR family ATPase [Hydrogenobaculum sp.]
MAINPKKVEFEISRIIKGKENVIRYVLAAFFAGGHILIEDVPGVGKTTLAISMAKAMSLIFNRIQFTSDLMPSDVLGIYIYDEKKRDFVFRPGPIFSNIILADEINRAPPKTQSALLEAMAEKTVSIEGKTHKLEDVFCVIATQNPMDNYGTFALPESELDRFMIKISMGYPSYDIEKLMILNGDPSERLADIQSVLTKQDVLDIIKHVKHIHVSEDVADVLMFIVQKTRKHKDVYVGVSPRGTLQMINLAKSYAFLMDRDFVTPFDIIELAPIAFPHRILTDDTTQKKNSIIIEEIVKEVKL